MADWFEVAKIVASGAVGAGAAVLGQYFSDRAADRRHQREIKQRERELWSQLAVAPLGPRRMEACEDLYDRIQNALETSKLSLDDYLAIRPKLLYVPALREDLIAALTTLQQATSRQDTQLQKDATAKLRDLQVQLETSLGLGAVEAGVRLVAESEVVRGEQS